MCREWNWPSQHIDDLRIIRECFSQTNILFTPFPEPPPNLIPNLSRFSKTGFLRKFVYSRNKYPVSRTSTKPYTKLELIFKNWIFA